MIDLAYFINLLLIYFHFVKLELGYSMIITKYHISSYKYYSYTIIYYTKVSEPQNKGLVLFHLFLFFYYLVVVVSERNLSRVLWCVWELIFFFFFYLFFLILYFFSFEFLFLFIFDNEEAHDCSHMTYHIMWGHRPRTN